MTSPLLSAHYVRITKVHDKGSFGPAGHPNIATGYTLEGFMLREPQTGEPFRVLRTKRNDVVALGVFMTSDVVSVVSPSTAAVESGVAQWVVNTQNSRYHVDLIPAPDTGCPPIELGLLEAFIADMGRPVMSKRIS